MELSIPLAANVFSWFPSSRGGKLFSFLCTLILSKLNYIAICLCNKDTDFIFLLNWFVVYSLPTAMSSVTGNHTMDLLYLLKENLKNLIFDLLIRGRSFQNLSYLSSLFVVKKMEILKNTLERITRHWISPCLHKSIGGRLPIYFTLSSSMLENKRIFSLVIWKLMSPFSVWPYNLV